MEKVGMNLSAQTQKQKLRGVLDELVRSFTRIRKPELNFPPLSGRKHVRRLGNDRSQTNKEMNISYP